MQGWFQNRRYRHTRAKREHNLSVSKAVIDVVTEQHMATVPKEVVKVEGSLCGTSAYSKMNVSTEKVFCIHKKVDGIFSRNFMFRRKVCK